LSYRGLGDCFARLANCIYFELTQIAAGDAGAAPYAFTFYDACPKGFFARIYVKEVLGSAEDPSCDEYYYRLGYCPADLREGCLVARTLLYPGFNKTPEAAAIRSSKLDQASKQQLLDAASDLDAATIERTKDLSLVKWFHENTVPKLFDYLARFTTTIPSTNSKERHFRIGAG
jgi:hypothetical protein